MGGNHMSMIDEIREKCSHLESRDDGAIATILSQGRTRPRERLIGIGTVLETLGMERGTALLSFIEGQPTLKYVWKLIEASNLNIGSPLVGQSLDQFAQIGVITQEDASNLKALGVEPDPVTAQQVAKALEGTETWPI